ncbi:BolA family protein [Chondromyces apiculatus]|uniref:Cell division protein BolA n=1 Tax=Chondromyces apiculatus DSM 436 TaxID=1192034 RepID=A0A017SYZ0_9BACT|nr:BolA family protein [Chondromyces apiculatus]EYF01506.1 Cell division protein BolA [Chondromyces apiculatus DSM 436]
MATSRQETIQTVLSSGLEPVHLDVENESRMHSVAPGSETHFKVLVVSAAFQGMNAVQRHRRVNELLREEFTRGLHALSLRALTPDEWAQQPGANFRSPPCLGGSKAG